MQSPAESLPVSPAVLRAERKLLFIVAAVQFVNVLDFMMVMPLGPDFARALSIPTSQIGIVGASYTGAAAVAGIVGAFFLDRFDRRKALGVALAGLMTATAAGGLAWDLHSMVAARVLAGMFGGPATSLALAIVSDVVPPERRGRAMGLVMSAFAVASVLGVPAGLELARLGGWSAPFFGVALLGAVLAALAIRLLPPLKPPPRPVSEVPAGSVLQRPGALQGLFAAGLMMCANFMLVPNLATYWQFNFGYPREHLGLLYLVGGLVSFAIMRVVGQLVDRYGAALICALGSVAYLACLFVSFVVPQYSWPVIGLFVVLMGSTSFRFVPLQSLASRVPLPSERARYMSTQSAVQHIAAALGAVLASQLLTEQPGGRLVGMNHVGMVSMTLGAFVPVLLWLVEGQVRARERAVAVPHVPGSPGKA
jgi:predicted MFS family arabinose efflux permease